MFKTIMVAMSGNDGDGRALDAAAAVGRPFKAHIDCVRVRIDPASAAMRASILDIPSVDAAERYMEALKQEDQRLTKAAHASFDDACRRHSLAAAAKAPGPDAMSASWIELTGDPLWDTVAQGRFHDLLVVDRQTELADGELGSLVVSSGRPVLIPGGRGTERIGGTVAIAWKETAEAARAVTAAMPLLERAERVIVIGADEAGNEAAATLHSAECLATSLRWHGIRTEARLVVPGERAAAPALFAAAAEQSASLVIMGAYGHSRVREMIFGGFTRHVLKEAPLPVFLFH